MSLWIFSNNRTGYYEDSDWDSATILKHKRYYFKSSENNRTKVASGDRADLREYGSGLWGMCEISGDWTDDPEAKNKYEIEAGWFPIAKVRGCLARPGGRGGKLRIAQPGRGVCKKMPRLIVRSCTMESRITYRSAL